MKEKVEMFHFPKYSILPVYFPHYDKVLRKKNKGHKSNKGENLLKRKTRKIVLAQKNVALCCSAPLVCQSQLKQFIHL